MQVKAVVANNKLFSCHISLKMKLGKAAKITLKQQYGNLGSHEFLKMPVETSEAKPLPKK